MNFVKKWYQEHQENAREKFLAGHYPGHERVPNVIVRWLYGVGYFVGDFVPLILNFINGVYMSIKRLLAFIVGLLIEASTVIVLIGTIVFSISHSIELLQRAGATGGFEYVGVLIFEVVFISCSAVLTGILMSGEKNPHKNFGFWFVLAGFASGIAFVLWSNVTAMVPTWEGMIIGIMTPVMLIIAEGILAYRNMDLKGNKAIDAGYIPEDLRLEIPKLTLLAQLMKEHNVSVDELKHQVQAYRNQQAGESLSSQESESSQLEISQEKSSQKDVVGEWEKKYSQAGESESSQMDSSQVGEFDSSQVSQVSKAGEASQTKLGELVSQETDSSWETSQIGELESSQKEKELEDEETSQRENAVKSMVPAVSQQREEAEFSQTDDTKIEFSQEGESSQAGDFSQKERSSQVGEWEKSSQEKSSQVSRENISSQAGELERKKFSQKNSSQAGEMKSSQKKVVKVSVKKSSQRNSPKQETSQAGEINVEELSPQEQFELALKKAREMFEREGTLPPRRKLVDEYGGKEWPARRALNRLDFEIALKKAEEILEQEGKLPNMEQLQKQAKCKKESAKKALEQLEKQLEVTA